MTARARSFESSATGSFVIQLRGVPSSESSMVNVSAGSSAHPAGRKSYRRRPKRADLPRPRQRRRLSTRNVAIVGWLVSRTTPPPHCVRLGEIPGARHIASGSSGETRRRAARDLGAPCGRSGSPPLQRAHFGRAVDGRRRPAGAPPSFDRIPKRRRPDRMVDAADLFRRSRRTTARSSGYGKAQRRWRRAASPRRASRPLSRTTRSLDVGGSEPALLLGP